MTPVFSAIQGSVAPKTWIEYSIAWKKWLLFTEELGFFGSSPTEHTIWAFLCSLMQKNRSFNHINKSLAGISFFLKLHNQPGCKSFFSVRQALKGYRRRTFIPDMRRPISLDLLRNICLITHSVCRSEQEALLFHSAFVLIFFAALCISELVPNNKKAISDLKFGEVVISQEKVQVFISRCQTYLSGRGNRLILHACGDSIICPYVILSKYLLVRPSCSGNFLVHLDFFPLTKFQFSAIFQRCLAQLGLSHMNFSSHSFCIGAATEAARLGLNDSKMFWMFGSLDICLFTGPINECVNIVILPTYLYLLTFFMLFGREFVGFNGIIFSFIFLLWLSFGLFQIFW